MPDRAIRMVCPWARGLRWRGTEVDGLLARPDKLSRCTLPITELREMPPSSAAIWLADNPSLHSFFKSSTRSSVQFMVRILHPAATASAESVPSLRRTEKSVAGNASFRTHLENGASHEISCRRCLTLLYGAT